MTVLYDSKETLRIIISTRGSVWSRVLPFCLLSVGITLTTYFLYKEDIVDLTFADDGHKILSVMVAFLVVSRVNVAYKRFWDARTLLSSLLCCCRQFSSHVAVFTNTDLEDRAEEWRAMMREGILEMLDTSLKMIQDEDFQSDKAIDYVEHAHDEKGIPKSLTQMANELQQNIVAQHLYLKEPLLIQKELRLHQFIGDFLALYAELAKYPATPYPFPTAQMSRMLLFVWMFTLPFALVANSNYSAIAPSILMFFITYGFFGLEFVSIELDDPFGDDANDLETNKLSTVIKAGINNDLSPKLVHFLRTSVPQSEIA